MIVRKYIMFFNFMADIFVLTFTILLRYYCKIYIRIKYHIYCCIYNYYE